MRSVLGLSQKDMSKRLGMALSTYQHYERGEREAPVTVITKITANGFSADWFLTGNGTPYIKDAPAPAPQEIPQASNVVELRHMELVKGFKDKPRAYEINRQLKELESLDDETFKRIETYIKATVDQVRYAAERSPQYGDRRHTDRRVDTDSNSLGAQDRRTGQDRRKASDGHH